MARVWTAEQKARQAEAIRRWRPWESATGPKTPEGKAKSAMRGFKNDPRGRMKERRLILALISEDARALASASRDSLGE